MIRRAFWIAATPIRVGINQLLPRLRLFPNPYDNKADTATQGGDA